MKIPALLMLACVLGFMLGVRTRSAVRTPALQADRSAAPRPSPNAARPYAVDGRESTMGTVALQVEEVAVRTPPLQIVEAAAVRTPPLQSPTNDDFNRTEATDLLKTKDRALDRAEPILPSQQAGQWPSAGWNHRREHRKGVKNEGDSHYIIESKGDARETPTILMKTNCVSGESALSL
jgi:hypothetical protein